MNDKDKRVAVLFVCMGNICRSPTAEGVFRHVVAESDLADRILIDSAGTHAYHVGKPPDQRSQSAAERRGYTLENLRARKVEAADFERFDYVIAMDRENQALLTELAEEEHRDRIRLFLEYSTGREDEVPDPYYGGAAGFERVLDLVEDASRGLLEALRSRHFA
jgi:protein-tyrosine phosphatase